MSKGETSDDYSEARLEQIKGDVGRTDEAAKAEQRANELADIHLKRVKEDQRRLRTFYCVTRTILVFTVVVTFLVVVYLAYKDELSGNVVIAFFASVTAQIIGLAHIISRYFFPEGGGLTRMPSNVG